MKNILFKKFIGIDLGTDNTRVYMKGRGIIINEPSIVAYNNRTSRVVAVGRQAKSMLSRTPSHITALRPMSNGVIADFDMAKEMIQSFLRSSELPWSWFTHIIGTVPTNLTEVERKSVIDLLKETGANEVSLLEQPLAAAFSSQLSVHTPSAYMIVDIGAGTTDMAIISMNGIVVSKRLKIAGDHFNEEIIKGVKNDIKLNIGEPTSEEIKLAVGSALPRSSESLEVTIRGRDISTGLPKEVTVKDSQVRSWISDSLKTISSSLKDLIDMTPPELVGDIYKNGIYMCGGGSLLRGIDELIEKEIGVEVNIVDEPITCVARGSGVITEKFEDYKHLLNNFPSPLLDN
ncbi:MAG: rod shape-determining protein [Candidatus Paceibacterota bacterium]